MTRPHCSNCKFWSRLDEHWSGAFDDCDVEPLTNYGFCMRYPPTGAGEKEIIVLQLLDENDNPTGKTTVAHSYAKPEFPITEEHQRCGEHMSVRECVSASGQPTTEEGFAK